MEWLALIVAIVALSAAGVALYETRRPGAQEPKDHGRGKRV